MRTVYDVRMVARRTAQLLAFARALLRADTIPELLRVTRDEARSAVGYGNVWFMIGEKEDPDVMQLVDFDGADRDNVRAVAPRLTVRGDAFLEELIASDAPVVIADARLDPRTNKEIVAALQNRTLINIPLRLVEKPFGLFGLGTFGDEGCRPPTDAELDYLVGMASQIAVAASRVMLQESRVRAAMETRYRLLFENMSAAFAFCEVIRQGHEPVDFIVLEVNQAFVRNTGVQRDAVVGRHITDLYPAIREVKPDLIELCGRVAITGEPTQFDIDFWPLERSYSVTVHRPSADHFVTVFTDVTPIRRQVHELKAINSELEAFSYSVSHDLQAPLRSIDGFSQLVIEDYGDKLDEVGLGYLQRVRASAQHMAVLIDEILALSRVTRAEMRWTTVDLSAVARSVADQLASAAPSRVVRFEIEPALSALGDPVLLRQLLENLLDNAFKFTSRHASAHIRVGQQSQRGEHVYYVQDDGAGFDMEHTGKLFGTFERLHTTEQFPGTGIGLATVQRIVRRHGGVIWAEAAVEQGATFYFTLCPAKLSASAEPGA